MAEARSALSPLFGAIPRDPTEALWRWHIRFADRRAELLLELSRRASARWTVAFDRWMDPWDPVDEIEHAALDEWAAEQIAMASRF